MIAAIYARKSTDQNLPDAEKSVTRQVEHATAYAARKGGMVDPAHVYQDDGISGAEFERRAGLTALAAALRPRPAFDAVWYLSRLETSSASVAAAPRWVQSSTDRGSICATKM
jgi:DNA invertase Pin-like site-specific DNA recombinase